MRLIIIFFYQNIHTVVKILQLPDIHLKYPCGKNEEKKNENEIYIT